MTAKLTIAKLTKKDKEILNVLCQNCKLTTKEISEQINIPITTIHNRIKRMEKEGIIKSYKALVDHKKLGNDIQAFIHLTVDYKYKVPQMEIAKKIFLMPETEECCILTGTSDIIAKVCTKNVDELNNLIIERLRNIKGVEKTMTSIVLKNIEDACEKKTNHFSLD